MDAKPLLGAVRDRAYVRDRLGAGGDLHHLHARQQRGGGGRHQVRLLLSLFFWNNLTFLPKDAWRSERRQGPNDIWKPWEHLWVASRVSRFHEYCQILRWRAPQTENFFSLIWDKIHLNDYLMSWKLGNMWINIPYSATFLNFWYLLWFEFLWQISSVNIAILISCSWNPGSLLHKVIKKLSKLTLNMRE